MGKRMLTRMGRSKSGCVQRSTGMHNTATPMLNCNNKQSMIISLIAYLNNQRIIFITKCSLQPHWFKWSSGEFFYIGFWSAWRNVYKILNLYPKNENNNSNSLQEPPSLNSQKRSVRNLSRIIDCSVLKFLKNPNGKNIILL